MKQYQFKATIEAAVGENGYVFFPYDVQKEFGTRGQVPVRVTFDGVSCTGTMVKYGHPQHMVPLVKAIRQQIGKVFGDTVSVIVERDMTERIVAVPTEFANLMKNEGMLATFEKLSYTNRKEYCRSITEAKREETRAKRLAESIEMLRAGVKTPG
jgi:Domain of unknown function (DUF1905)/Bacteriocin-protection, YdeI or OmpD-Associated